MYGGDGWMWHGGSGGGAWAITAMVLVVFFALVITAVIVAARYLSDGGHNPPHRVAPGRAPEHLLAERYARGEIDDEEFRRRMAILREH